MKTPTSLFTGVAILLLASVASAIDVRETEIPLMSVHRPMDPARMQAMLGDKLVPDVYDGKAYIQVSVFYISKLEGRAPLIGFVNMFQNSWCMRVSAYVKNKETNEKGYVILSADFEDTIKGMIMTNGCRSSQLGTQCGYVKVNHSTTGQAHHLAVADNDSDRPLLKLDATLIPIANEKQAFFKWANERYVRFRLSEDKKTLLRGQQEAKTWEKNYEIQTKNFYSAVFNAKFAKYGWVDLDDVQDPCTGGYCFFSGEAVFIDNEAK